MDLNQRWPCLGETLSTADAGLSVFAAFPGAWWIAIDQEMIGPFDDRSILRAVRLACTPTIDGCELGPRRLGVRHLSPRCPLARGPRWRRVLDDPLPPGVTRYDRHGLEPISACCTVFDAMPNASWGTVDGWERYVNQRPVRGGRLVSEWNAHPAGSLLFTREPALDGGFTIVEFASGNEMLRSVGAG
jgi:hypothetical protein